MTNDEESSSLTTTSTTTADQYKKQNLELAREIKKYKEMAQQKQKLIEKLDKEKFLQSMDAAECEKNLKKSEQRLRDLEALTIPIHTSNQMSEDDTKSTSMSSRIENNNNDND